MMKTLLLLAFAVLVSGASVNHGENSLGELREELVKALENLPKNNKAKPTYLPDLKRNCRNYSERVVFFCQAEEELKRVKFDHFHTDKRLMRTLSTYNKHHGKTCKPVDKDQDEIPLHDFLNNLLTCVKHVYSQPKN